MIRDSSGKFISLWHDIPLVVRKVAEMRGALENLQPVWDKWHPLWLVSRKEVFTTRGAAQGTPWQSYGEEERQYLAVKRKILGRWITDKDLLRWGFGDREKLYPSLTQKSHPDHFAQFTNTSNYGNAKFVVGTKLDYAQKHEKGHHKAPDWAGNYIVPRRPFMGWTPMLERGTKQILMDHAKGALKGWR